MYTRICTWFARKIIRKADQGSLITLLNDRRGWHSQQKEWHEEQERFLHRIVVVATRTDEDIADIFGTSSSSL